MWDIDEAYLPATYAQLKLNEWFAFIDCNGDGRISPAEYDVQQCQGRLVPTRQATPSPVSTNTRSKCYTYPTSQLRLVLPTESKSPFFVLHNATLAIQSVNIESIERGFEAFDYDCNGVLSSSESTALCAWAVSQESYNKSIVSCLKDIVDTYGSTAFTAKDVISKYNKVFRGVALMILRPRATRSTRSSLRTRVTCGFMPVKTTRLKYFSMALIKIATASGSCQILAML